MSVDSIGTLDSTGNLSFGALLLAITDNPVLSAGAPGTVGYTPTEGRVAEDTTTGTVYVGTGSSWVDAADAVGLTTTVTASTPTDVLSLSDPSQGEQAYHDGSGGNTEGPAFYDGSAWTSTVDGSTIS